MLALRTTLLTLLALTLFAFSNMGCSSEEEPGGTDASDPADASDSTDPSDTSSSNCEDTEGFQNRIAELQNAFNAITENVAEYPIGVALPEATNGTLEITLNPNAFPLVLDDRGVFAAASMLGEGRVVAFSGQDFISSQDRSTLLGVGDVNTLLQNAARWATCLLYTSPSPRDQRGSRMPSSA